MVKRVMLAAAMGLAMLAGCGGESPSQPAGGSRGGSAARPAAPKTEADQKAEALLKQAYDAITAKKADEAEAALMKVIEMKGQLSEGVKKQVTPAIVALGGLDPKRATKLGPMFGE